MRRSGQRFFVKIDWSVEIPWLSFVYKWSPSEAYALSLCDYLSWRKQAEPILEKLGKRV